MTFLQFLFVSGAVGIPFGLWKNNVWAGFWMWILMANVIGLVFAVIKSL